jgi:hypothetical protein
MKKRKVASSFISFTTVLSIATLRTYSTALQTSRTRRAQKRVVLAAANASFITQICRQKWVAIIGAASHRKWVHRGAIAAKRALVDVGCGILADHRDISFEAAADITPHVSNPSGCIGRTSRLPSGIGRTRSRFLAFLGLGLDTGAWTNGRLDLGLAGAWTNGRLDLGLAGA